MTNEDLKLNRHEVQEEPRFFWDCPGCGKNSVTEDDPMETDTYHCDKCGESVSLFDEE